MVREASWRRLRAACNILSRNKQNFSENYLLKELLREYLITWRGKMKSTGRTRRYNLTGKKYVRRAIYINYSLYRAAWQRSSHSGESVSRMVDFAVRCILPRVLARLLAVAPKSYFENQNSEYWRRRWFCRKIVRQEIFLNYSEYSKQGSNHSHEWVQITTLRPSGVKYIPPWDLRSCFAYLYHGESAIYTPP